MIAFLEKLKAETSGLTDFCEENFTAILYRDRSYPEGDDVCVGQIECIARFKKSGENGRIYVVSSGCEVFSVEGISYYSGNRGTLNCKNLQKIN